MSDSSYEVDGLYKDSFTILPHMVKFAIPISLAISRNDLSYIKNVKTWVVISIEYAISMAVEDGSLEVLQYLIGLMDNRPKDQEYAIKQGFRYGDHLNIQKYLLSLKDTIGNKVCDPELIVKTWSRNVKICIGGRLKIAKYLEQLKEVQNFLTSPKTVKLRNKFFTTIVSNPIYFDARKDSLDYLLYLKNSENKFVYPYVYMYKLADGKEYHLWNRLRSYPLAIKLKFYNAHMARNQQLLDHDDADIFLAIKNFNDLIDDKLEVLVDYNMNLQRIKQKIPMVLLNVISKYTKYTPLEYKYAKLKQQKIKPIEQQKITQKSSKCIIS